jgi:Cu/Ag efflux protein CusF
MRARRFAAKTRLAALALVLALAACGGGGPAKGEGEGIVRAVDVAAGNLTLDHGTIPGMMDAMRMDFHVADPTWLEGLEPGDTVRFEVVEEAGGHYTLTRLERLPGDGSGAE